MQNQPVCDGEHRTFGKLIAQLEERCWEMTKRGSKIFWDRGETPSGAHCSNALLTKTFRLNWLQPSNNSILIKVKKIMKNENQLADVLICVAIKRGGGFVQDQKFAPSDNKITIIDRLIIFWIWFLTIMMIMIWCQPQNRPCKANELSLTRAQVAAALLQLCCQGHIKS